MKSVTLRRPVLRDEMRRYLLAFLLGFGSLLLVILLPCHRNLFIANNKK